MRMPSPARSLLIAARWGLADSSHFSRLFRATYGMSPREFRSEKITLA
jgi:AraC-like DNA-binding protein